MFNITSAKITGNPGELGWAQVLENLPEDPEKQKARGHLFAVIATSSLEDVTFSGREILTRLNEEYFGNLESSAFNALENSLKKILSENPNRNVEITAVAKVGEVVYSAAAGGAQVSILRNGMLAKILVSPKDGVVCASGYPQENDLLVAGTSIFFTTVAAGILKAALEGLNPVLAVENLAPGILSRSDLGNLGAVIIKFSKENEILEVSQQAVKKISFEPVTKILDLVKEKSKNLLGSVSSIIPERKIYIKQEEITEEGTKSRKNTMTIGIILLVLLVISIGFGIRAKQNKDIKSRYQPTLQTAQHEFDEAVSLFPLEPIRARELFLNSRDKVSQLINNKVSDPDLTSLKNKIDEKQGEILGEYKIEPELFLDLSLLTSGFKADALSTSNEKLFILNKEGKRIVSVSIGNKKSQVVAGPDQIDEALNIASYEDRVFILNNAGVYEVGDEKTKVIDKDWEGEVIPYAYTGNFYLVDKSANTIWRYAGTEGKFGSRQNWLASGTKVDFSNAKMMAVDGTILVLTSTFKVMKFSLGSSQNFSISRVVPELTSIEAIYTNEELKYIYLLDRQNKRVVVLEKNGNFKAQYLDDKIGEAINLSVSEKEKKIILLTSDKLYSIEIKHL